MKMKKNNLLIYAIVLFTISIFELILFMNYSYFNVNLISFSLSLFLIPFFMIFEYNKTKSFFSLNIIFNLFGFLYTNFYIIQLILNNTNISDSTYLAMNLSYISILFFNIGFFTTKKEVKENGKESSYNLNILKLFIIILFVVSIIAEFYVIFYKIGFSAYINSSRANKSLLMEDYSLLSFYRKTIPLVSILSLYLLLKYKLKFSRSIFIVSFLLSIINSIFSVSRAELLSVLLPILFLLSYFKKISNKKVIAFGVISFILFGAWKGLSNGKLNVISYDSEFNSWYKICENVLYDNNGVNYLYGSSYLKTLLNLIIPVTKTMPLSSWYVKTYEYSVYVSGGGRGFSGVLEAYMNFWYFGNVLIYYIYGKILKKININSDLQIMIYMIIMTCIFQLFRSDSYSLLKTMMWFKIYPVLIMFFLAKKSYQKKIC